MSDGIRIQIELEENVSDALSRAIAAGQDLTRPMKEIAVHLASSAKLRFETERGPDGKPWKPSKRVAQTAVGAQGTQKATGQTLTLTGDLRNSIIEDWGSDFAEAGPERSGGAAIYAKIHQFGFDGLVQVPEHKRTVTSMFGEQLKEAVTQTVQAHQRHLLMPARPYMGFEEEDPEIISDIIGSHLKSAIAGAAI